MYAFSLIKLKAINSTYICLDPQSKKTGKVMEFRSILASVTDFTN